MGDEAHSRCTSGTLLMTRHLAPYIVETDFPKATIRRVFEFLKTHDIFFLHVIMAAARAIVDPAKNVPYSTIVTTLARNGVEFGIKVSALGEQWFTAPSPKIKTSFFSPKWDDSVATHDMGDSSITETVGLGGQITVCSPAQEYFLGGNFQTALTKTMESHNNRMGKQQLGHSQPRFPRGSHLPRHPQGAEHGSSADHSHGHCPCGWRIYRRRGILCSPGVLRGGHEGLC